ncbi:putative ribonuclease H-like domain-containing protein [Tanacetum coccineum]
MDINWQIAMIAIRMKKFYKKTGRRVRVDGKTPVGFDKKKLECFNCHNTGHFARECTAKGTNDGKKKRDSFYQHQEAGKQEKNQMGLLTMDDGIVNWGEHTEVEETNHALMAISSSVPHPLSGDYTPTPQEEIDESLYVYGKKGPQEPELNVSDDRSSEYSTCQTNDSAGSIGTSSEHSVDPESEISSVPPEVYVSTPITTNEKGVSDPKSKEVEPSCVSHIKTPRQPIKDQATPKVNRKNWNAMMERELGEGYSFTKKKCFVCGSLSHLIKDCDYYEKKMAREAEFKKQRVFNTGNGVAKPVWTNANRVNHANKFVPRSVQLNAGRPNINSVRPNINTGRTNINSVRPNINTGRTNVNPVRPRVNTGSSNVNTVRSRQPVPTKTSNSFSPKRPQVNQLNQRRHFSKSHSPVSRPIVRNTARMTYSHAVKGNWGSAVKTSAGYNWRNSNPNSNCDSGPTFIRTDHPLKNMVDRGIFDSGCSGHMTGNKDQLEDFEEFNGGSVTFGGSKGYISSKGKIRVGNLDFDSVSFVKELGHFNLFSISQICDKQHKVLFTETECLVVSSDFKMPDENQILLKVPRHHNMYSFDMKTPTPAKGFACLIAKATSDESKLWHRRLGHINFKNLNKLVKGNLVRGLPSKVFKNDHTCVACHKGKQHRASCKAKLERLITEPLHTLHMDLFGPTSVKSINHASYCLVITDDCTRFSWVFFLASKDETSGILQNFIRQIENQLSHRVKIIRSDNGTEFKNRDMLEFCGNKGIKQEYSNARTPQQNGVAERMNRTLIEAARTMLADSLLPTTFWAEAVSTACYIFNRVLQKYQNSAGTLKDFLKLRQGDRLGSCQCKRSCCYRFKLEQIGGSWAYTHEEGIDVDEVFAPVPRIRSYQVIGTPHGFVDPGSHLRRFIGWSMLCYGLHQVLELVPNLDRKEILYSDVVDFLVKGLIHGMQVKEREETGTIVLQLADASGITMLPNNEIFEGMGHMGYPTDGSFTFWKSFFTPQWRFFVNHILHCICSKSGGCDQFGSNIAIALICLSTGKVYNFSKQIFDGMVANLKSKTKFLMYPRFLQLILDIQTENKHPYLAVTLTKKIFGNMKRGFRRAPRPLLPAMLLVATTNPSAGREHPDVAQSQPSSSTIPVPSTSSPIPAPIPASTPTPIPETDPEPMEHTFEEPSPAHQHFSPPQEHAQGQMTVDDLLQVVPQLMTSIDSLEKDLKQTKLTMGSAIVKLVKKVKKLEGILKRRNVVLSDSEEEEPKDQGRKSQDDPLVSLVQGLPKSIDKGGRYKRRKETKGKKVVTSLDFQEEVSTGYAEGVNTGSIKVSTVSGQEKLVLLSYQIGYFGGKKEERSLKQVHSDSFLAQRLAEEDELNEQQKHRRFQGHGSSSQLKNLSAIAEGHNQWMNLMKLYRGLSVIDMVMNGPEDELLRSQPWTCTFLVAKGLTTSRVNGLMVKRHPNPFKDLMIHLSQEIVAAKIIKRWFEELQFKNNSKSFIYNILRKLKLKTLEGNLKFTSEDQVTGRIVGK